MLFVKRESLCCDPASNDEELRKAWPLAKGVARARARPRTHVNIRDFYFICLCDTHRTLRLLCRVLACAQPVEPARRSRCKVKRVPHLDLSHLSIHSLSLSCLRGGLRTQKGTDGHVPWPLDVGACGLDAGESATWVGPQAVLQPPIEPKRIA